MEIDLISLTTNLILLILSLSLSKLLDTVFTGISYMYCIKLFVLVRKTFFFEIVSVLLF